MQRFKTAFGMAAILAACVTLTGCAPKNSGPTGIKITQPKLESGPPSRGLVLPREGGDAFSGLGIFKPKLAMPKGPGTPQLLPKSGNKQ